MYKRGYSSILMSITDIKESTFLKCIRITNEESVWHIRMNNKRKLG